MDRTINKWSNCYFVCNGNEILSRIKFYDYHLDNFDWILLSDVETSKKYRNKGYASELIKALCIDVSIHKHKSLYLFVNVFNYKAISLYLNIGFKILKKYILDDGEYFIMYKENRYSNIRQLENMNFK